MCYNLTSATQASDSVQVLAGIVIYGENKLANKALDGLKFHV